MFIIDFDNTLFNTNLLVERIMQVFKDSGIDEIETLRSYRLSCYGEHGNNFGYSFANHLKVLSQDKYDTKLVEENLSKLLNTNDYNFDGVEEFLSFCRQKTDLMVLLTLGDNQFQRQKLANSGLEKFFDKIIIDNLSQKEKHVAQITDSKTPFYFINDNLIENRKIKDTLPNLDIVSKVNLKKFSVQDYIDSQLPYFNTLSEIKNYVANQLK